MKVSFRDIFCLLSSLVSWGYLFILFGWFAAHLLIGDRIPYLALANFLAVYLFIPLPVILVVAILCRSRSLGIGFALGAIAFLFLWGELFLPRFNRPNPGGPTLSVMTYNVLAWHTFTGPIMENIRFENPDVVCFQELNRTLARALGAEMIEEYPYQILEPVDNPSGIGVISKYPIRLTGEQLPLRWIGGPQVLELEWEGQVITLVNIHMTPTTSLAAPPVIEPSIRLRESQARLLVELARRSGPLILAGDANSAPLNESYKIIARELQDAWQEAGFGLGHTFPGSTIPGSDRPRLGNGYVPPWLARIDYVFHSQEWETVSARLARFEGVSDHRGVIAVFRLRR